MANVTTLGQCPFDLAVSAYNCSNPYPDCTVSGGFQFAVTWTLSQYIATCPTDWRLFDKDLPSLNQKALEQIFGSDQYQLYPLDAVIDRLVAWKIPLLVLVSNFTRPPLSWKAQMLVVVRLIGNGIGTMRSLLIKLEGCEERARYWEEVFTTRLAPQLAESASGRKAREAKIRRLWKAFALITNTYDEWGLDKGNAVRDYLRACLDSPSIDEKKFLKVCQDTAWALAADRSTTFLPMIAAQFLFFANLAIAVARIPGAASGPNPQTYIDIEGHSIGFSALFLHVIPNVIIGSIIGVSQSEDSVPRIFRNFQIALSKDFRDPDIRLPNDFLTDFDGLETSNTPTRESAGGIYTCQPLRLRQELGREQFSQMRNIEAGTHRDGVRHALMQRVGFLRPSAQVMPYLPLFVGLLAGPLISYLIPPIGFGPRSLAECVFVFFTFIISTLDYLPWNSLWVMVAKDVPGAIGMIIGVLVTQAGIFNRPSAFTLWGRTGAAVPEIPAVASSLLYGIRVNYPAIIFLAASIELVIFPALILWTYWRAVLVFTQPDCSQSRREQCWLALRKIPGAVSRKMRHIRTAVSRSVETREAIQGKESAKILLTIIHGGVESQQCENIES